MLPGLTDAVADQLIEVVAGVIFNAERTRVLLALRKPEQHQGDRWEFPGGKLDPGEARRDGLIRELEEELGIVVTRCEARSIVEHSYTDKKVRLHFWHVLEFSRTPVGREGQLLQWVALTDLGNFRFPEANQGIVDELMREGGLS